MYNLNKFTPAVLVNDVLHGHPVRPGCRRRVLGAGLAPAAAAAIDPGRDGVDPVDVVVTAGAAVVAGFVGGDGVVAQQVRRSLPRSVELGLVGHGCRIH